MGIKYLNRYISERCKGSLKHIHFCDLQNKTIVVDISIYMYKFRLANALIENIYIMLSLFERNNINPIFIFDGKPPPEKKNMLNQRYLERISAEEEYSRVCEKMHDNKLGHQERIALEAELQHLRRKCVYITKKEIQQIKDFISIYGYTWYQSPGEADDLCSLFVKQKKAWACLSEDMDMFVQGTPRVLRYFSLVNSSCVLYDTIDILTHMNITQEEFTYICILCGTDYNVECSNNVYDIFDMFRKFASSNTNKNNRIYSFINTIQNNPECQVTDKERLLSIYNLFTKIQPEYLQIVNNYVPTYNEKKCNEIRNILEEDGFVYPIKVC